MILPTGRVHNFTMKKIHLSAVIWKEENQYVSHCPELGVASAGDTPSQALENLREAVDLYLENAEALGIIEDILPSVESGERYATTLEVAR